MRSKGDGDIYRAWTDPEEEDDDLVPLFVVQLAGRGVKEQG